MSSKPLPPYDEIVKKFLTGARHGTESTVAKWVDHVKDDPNVMLLAWDQVTNQIAKRKGGYKALACLVEHGMDPNTRVSSVYPTTTALRLISGVEDYGNHASIAAAGKSLIDHGANIDSKGEFGTALSSAARNGHVDLAKSLLEAGATKEISGFYLNNPLHGATKNGRTEIVSLLLEHGANPNTQNLEGETALFYCRHLDIAHKLLEAGIDPDLKDRSGQTAEVNQWGDGDFRLPEDVRTAVRQARLDKVAQASRVQASLASPEEVLAHRNRGRFM